MSSGANKMLKALALVIVCYSAATNALASRSALNAALTPTAPTDAAATEAAPEQQYATVQHVDAASSAAEAPVATSVAHEAAGFALIQDMMHSLDSQLDTVVEHELSLAETSARTKRARTAVAQSHWASIDAATAAEADERATTTALVAEQSSAASTADVEAEAEAETDAEAEVATDEPAHRAMRLTDASAEASEEVAAAGASDASFVETAAEGETEADAESQTWEEAWAEAEAKEAVDAAEAEAAEKPKKAKGKAKAPKAKAAKGGKGKATASATAAKGGDSKNLRLVTGPVKSVAGGALEGLREVPLVPKDMSPLADMHPLKSELGLDPLLSHPLLAPNRARGTDAARSLPAGTTKLSASTGDSSAVASHMDKGFFGDDNAHGNPWELEAHVHMSPAQHAAAHLHDRLLGSGGDPFHVFTSHDADALHRAADWIAPEVMEKGTILHYLSTAENAVTASSKLYHAYSEALNHLMNQIRLYKPNVAEWVNGQKVKAVETVEGVKETLRTFGPQLRELQRVYTDALAKEQFYRSQTQSMQAERMLQTSSPTVAAVEKSMMPNDKYHNALSTLQHYVEAAAKVRSDAQAAILAKKKAIKDGMKWLSGSHETLMSWLKRQHRHLLLVLKQARAVATEWQHSLHEFRSVHLQATHLVRQYQLALHRIDLEDQLRRMRLSWKTYEVRNHNGVASEDGHASSQEMSIKFGALHRALHDLAMQQAFHGAPPAPPANWLSILSSDPQPKSSVPLNAPPLPQPLSDPSSRHFLNAPVEPQSAEHVPGSEPMNHILDPIRVPSGHIGIYPSPTTYPHTGLDGVEHDHHMTYPDHHFELPHGHDDHAHAHMVPGHSVHPPANPPEALHKTPVPAKDGDDKEEKKGDGDSSESSSEESFIQKAAALHHALATGFGSESVFAGAAAPPAALTVHPANPTTQTAFFEAPPAFTLPASFVAALPQPPPAPAHAAQAPAPAAQPQQQMMAPPPQRHGGVPPPPGAVAAGSPVGAAYGRPPVRHAVAPAMPILPPPPLSSTVADYDGVDL